MSEEPVATLNPDLFRAVLRGEHRLNGFRNSDIAACLYRRAPRTEDERRSRTARASRLLQLLRAHGLITKVRGSYRYRITTKGEKDMNASLYMRKR